ncbi:MAG TPA: hypothetical protein VN176_09090 [Verrucomicrobiae bacterium]|nr:hypothetical protein [Verrucomicrobiae bacterium]
MLTSNMRMLATAAVLSAALASSGPSPEPLQPLPAYHDGTDVLFAPDSAGAGPLATFGPWTLGRPLREEKPLDKRLNLYVVVPGRQYRSAAYLEYDHNLIVNMLTEDKPREWDVYWCFVLDPALQADIRGEHELLVAAQQSFRPADLFDLEDVPGQEVMGEKIAVKSMADLRHYRRKDGSLPRVLIVPARLALRAAAALPAAASKPPAP